LHGELLGDRAAPGNAHDMHALVAEYVQQLRGEPRQHPQPIGQARRRRFAGTGDVEDDDFPIRIEHLNERTERLQTAPNSVEDQQGHARRLALPQPHAQFVT